MGLGNHQWLWDQFTDLARRSARSVSGRVSTDQLTALDFGCGDGQLITRSLKEGVGDFYGSETFYGDGLVALENGNGADVPAATRARIRVTQPGQPLPFDDNTFDFVCSNQVFEHITDLHTTIAELARITKPTGVQVHVFPTRERLIEGHLGVPLIHRLPESRRKWWASRWYPRVRYGATTTSFEQWWDEMGPFLRDHTVYRTSGVYDTAFAAYFRVQHIEADKLAYHLGHSRRLFPLTGAARMLVPRRFEQMRATYAVRLVPRAHGLDLTSPQPDHVARRP